MGMMENKEQEEWATKAAKHHTAFNVKQLVYIVTSAYYFKSEAAAFEIIRLMKAEPGVYGSLFIRSIEEK